MNTEDIFSPEQIAHIKKIFQSEFDDNYRSGTPQIPPHTHNGIDNLKIPSSSIDGSLVGGTNTEVQFNDNGVLAGDTGLLYLKDTQTLQVDTISAIANDDSSGNTLNIVNPAFGTPSNSSDINIFADSADDSTGSINIYSGNTINFATGLIAIFTGNANADSSGSISIFTGNASGSGKHSGGVTIYTGNGNSNAHVGDINMYTSFGASNGDVNITAQGNNNANLSLTGYGFVYIAAPSGNCLLDISTDIEFRSGTLNFGFTNGSQSVQGGGGVGVIYIQSATTVPNSNPTGGGILYVQSGALKYRGSGGTVTTIAPA